MGYYPYDSNSFKSKRFYEEYIPNTLSTVQSKKREKDAEIAKWLLDNFLEETRKFQGGKEFKQHAEIRKADYQKIRELAIKNAGGDTRNVKKEDISTARETFYKELEEKGDLVTDWKDVSIPGYTLRSRRLGNGKVILECDDEDVAHVFLGRLKNDVAGLKDHRDNDIDFC